MFEELSHFLDLALQGARRGGLSSGQYASHQLATAMLQHAPSLDGSALDGAIEFLKLAHGAHRTAERLLADGPAKLKTR